VEGWKEVGFGHIFLEPLPTVYEGIGQIVARADSHMMALYDVQCPINCELKLVIISSFQTTRKD